MEFSRALRNESAHTYTENGACALNTTGGSLVDLFATVGALRSAEENRIHTLFSEAANEDLLMATKIAFYARDIRGGLGERQTFRTLLQYMAENYPQALRPNLDLIGVYGRYDDLYCLIGTPLEDDMWASMKKQFEEDLVNMQIGNAVSLLGKWVKTADASSAKTRELGILTAQKLGYSVREYKRCYRALRRHIGVVEQLMSRGKWDEIIYPEVSSRAMMIYRNAFQRHDGERFNGYLSSLARGEEKINAGVLYPYDLVEKYADKWWEFDCQKDAVVEELWKNLPDYVGGEHNAMVIADTSGSMMGRPMASALGLAVYFAERNKGAYHNLFMEFSSQSKVHKLRGNSLLEKLKNVMNDSEWGGSTNLHGAFKKVLRIAIENDVPQNEMPKSLIVISDMEIDYCGDDNWDFYESVKQEYAKHGYEIPEIIFWNVYSRCDTFLADANRKGVQLVSGQSASTFRTLMSSIGLTAYELMEKTINSERYAPITIGERIFQPRVEITNKNHTSFAYHNWGTYDNFGEASDVVKRLLAEISRGDYNVFLSQREKDNGYYINACVEVLQERDGELKLIEIIEV